MEDNGFKTLTRWISRHQKRFKAEHYTTDEIVNLAIACGFDRSAVAQWQTSKLFKEVIR